VPLALLFGRGYNNGKQPQLGESMHVKLVRTIYIGKATDIRKRISLKRQGYFWLCRKGEIGCEQVVFDLPNQLREKKQYLKNWNKLGYD